MPECIQRAFLAAGRDPLKAADISYRLLKENSLMLREELDVSGRRALRAGAVPADYFAVVDLAHVPSNTGSDMGRLLKAWQEEPPNGAFFSAAMMGSETELDLVDPNVFASGVGRIVRRNSP